MGEFSWRCGNAVPPGRCVHDPERAPVWQSYIADFIRASCPELVVHDSWGHDTDTEVDSDGHRDRPLGGGGPRRDPGDGRLGGRPYARSIHEAEAPLDLLAGRVLGSSGDDH